MSNYPNMSYCQCENTLLALRQILTAMKEEGPMFISEMSHGELLAYRELFHACEDFLTVSEELEDELDYYDSERDGQPDEAQEWHDFDADC